MSGLWSFRSTPARSEEVLKAALPLAFLNVASVPYRSNGEDDASPLQGISDGSPDELRARTHEQALDSDSGVKWCDGILLQRDWLRRVCDAQDDGETASPELTPQTKLGLLTSGAGDLTPTVPTNTTTLEPEDLDDASKNLFAALHAAVDQVSMSFSQRNPVAVSRSSAAPETPAGRTPRTPLLSTRRRAVGVVTGPQETRVVSEAKRVHADAHASSQKIRQMHTEQKSLLATTETLVSQVADVRRRTNDEIERRQCALAVARLQRVRAVEKIVSSPPPPADVPSPHARSSRNITQQTHCSSNLQSSSFPTLTPTAKSHHTKLGTPTASSIKQGGTTNDVFSRLSQVRTRSAQPRSSATIEEIEALQNAGMRVVFDPQRKREQHLRELHRGQCAAALDTMDRRMRARENQDAQIQRINQLRIMKFYGWLPWRAQRLESLLLFRHADNCHSRRALATHFRAWAQYTTSQKQVRKAVKVARCLALTRFIEAAWKRSVLVNWRMHVLDVKAKERTATRHRTMQIWKRWKMSIALKYQKRLAALQTAETRAARAFDRMTMVHVWRKWSDACEKRHIEREREAFRCAVASSLATISFDS